MPREIEERLRREAEAKFPNDKERQDAYVYGTLHRIETQQGRKFRRGKRS